MGRREDIEEDSGSGSSSDDDDEEEERDREDGNADELNSSGDEQRTERQRSISDPVDLERRNTVRRSYPGRR